MASDTYHCLFFICVYYLCFLFFGKSFILGKSWWIGGFKQHECKCFKI